MIEDVGANCLHFNYFRPSWTSNPNHPIFSLPFQSSDTSSLNCIAVKRHTCKQQSEVNYIVYTLFTVFLNSSLLALCFDLWAVIKQSPTTSIILMYSSYRDEDRTPLSYRVNIHVDGSFQCSTWKITKQHEKIDSTCVHNTTYNMHPAKGWAILTGYCRKMRHLDSTCIHNKTHNMHPAERWVCTFANLRLHDTYAIEKWGKRTATYARLFKENRLQKICLRGAEGDNSWLSDCAQNCTCTNM